jgi:methylated-DNA-protein-cysteine methyltransferase-like protein
MNYQLGTNMLASSLKEEIWQLVASIPSGRVATYGQVARLAGFPKHARYVGTTLKQLPKGTTLPWYRVLKSNGELAFPAGSTAWKRQKSRLEAEGILLKGMKVPLSVYQYDQ